MSKPSRKEPSSVADTVVSFTFAEFSKPPKTSGPPSGSSERFVCGLVDEDGSHSARNEVCQPGEDDTSQVALRIERAFRKGLDQGRAEAMLANREKVEQATTALDTAIGEFIQLRRQDAKRMEVETVRLALAIAKKIIGHHASTGAVISDVVQTALQMVADPRLLTLRVNPKDMRTICQFKEDWLTEQDRPAEFQIEADASILQGGCIIETKLGDVDARLDQQIKIIEDQLVSRLPKVAQ